MRAVLQRVKQAAVAIGDQASRTIGQGLVILLGVTQDDTPAHAAYLARKIAHLRIFEDDSGKMNRSHSGGSRP